MNVGIICGGRSREREVSLAGARTIYDCIDKSKYTPIPVFIDHYNRFYILKWENLYKGTISDFIPFNIDKEDYEQYIGEQINIEKLKNIIDIAFIVIHGKDGEDGNIQGLFEYYNVPYTGSRLLGSVIGIDKLLQKKMMNQYGYLCNKYKSLDRHTWNNHIDNPTDIIDELFDTFDIPFMIKATNSGSSIGVHKVNSKNYDQVINYINDSFQQSIVYANTWFCLSKNEKIQFANNYNNIRNNFGYPIFLGTESIDNTYQLINCLDDILQTKDHVILYNENTNNNVIIEEYIYGREFSCIVIENEQYEPVALPPTEIFNISNFFDYRSKYMTGIVQKKTPIDVDIQTIDKIRKTCQNVFKDLNFDIYARIDGFLTDNNQIYIDDPNTIPGMELSSIIFQGASEIGISPKNIISFVIEQSMNKFYK